MNILLSIAFMLLLVCFSLGQIGRIGIGEHPVFLHIYEVPLVLYTILLIYTYRLKPLLNSSLRIFHTMLIWVGVSFILSLFYYSWYEHGIAIMYMARLMTHIVFGVYFWHHIKQIPPNYIKYISALIYFLIFWFAATMVVQYMLYSNIGNIAYLGWDPHVERAVGLFLEPPLAAGFLGLSILFLYTHISQQLYKYGGILLLLVLFILTHSRGGFIALCVTLGYFLIKKTTIRYAFIIPALVIIVVGFFNNPQLESTNMFRTTSIQSRFVDYKQGIEIWSQHIISGIGYNHIRFEKETYEDEEFVEDYNPSHGISSFHSSFLIVGVTTGIVGLILFLIGLYQLGRINEFTRYAVVFLSVISLFDNVLLHPFILLFLVLYGSIVFQTSTVIQK